MIIIEVWDVTVGRMLGVNRLATQYYTSFDKGLMNMTISLSKSHTLADMGTIGCILRLVVPFSIMGYVEVDCFILSKILTDLCARC